MAQQLTPSTRRGPRVEANSSMELWVLVIEEQGRPDPLLLRLLLQQMRVQVADDPVVPYALAFEGLFDAIILDRPMQGKEGSIALSEMLRQVGVITPIVVLTGSVSVDDIIAAIEAGADDVLPPSVGAEMLAARLRSLQRRSALFWNASDKAVRHADASSSTSRVQSHDARGPPVTGVRHESSRISG